MYRIGHTSIIWGAWPIYCNVTLALGGVVFPSPSIHCSNMFKQSFQFYFFCITIHFTLWSSIVPKWEQYDNTAIILLLLFHPIRNASACNSNIFMLLATPRSWVWFPCNARTEKPWIQCQVLCINVYCKVKARLFHLKINIELAECNAFSIFSETLYNKFKVLIIVVHDALGYFYCIY